MSELTSKTIAELRDGFRGGEFSAREIADSFNAAVAGAKALNAYTVETPDDALAAADAADQARGSGEIGAGRRGRRRRSTSGGIGACLLRITARGKKRQRGEHEQRSMHGFL